jgi:hypothetical protein
MPVDMAAATASVTAPLAEGELSAPGLPAWVRGVGGGGERGRSIKEVNRRKEGAGELCTIMMDQCWCCQAHAVLPGVYSKAVTTSQRPGHPPCPGTARPASLRPVPCMSAPPGCCEVMRPASCVSLKVFSVDSSLCVLGGGGSGGSGWVSQVIHLSAAAAATVHNRCRCDTDHATL